MDFSALIIKMVIFLVLLATGYFMARKKILTPEFTKSASALIIDVFIVASIINSVLGNRPELSAKNFGIAFAMLTLAIVLTYLIAKIASFALKKESNTAHFEMVTSITNTLFVGMPIVSSVCGSEATFYVGMSCIPYNLILYTYGVWRLSSGKGEGKVKIKDVLSVCLIAAVVSLVIFIVNPPVPKVITELFSCVSAATVPMSMIVIGASLGPINPAQAFKEKINYIISFVRLIVTPLITFFLVRLFTDNQVLILTCTVIAGCPVGSIATPISIQYGYEATYSSKAIMVSTILGMFTLPILIKVLFA